jgi:hypothetical protein
MLMSASVPNVRSGSEGPGSNWELGAGLSSEEMSTSFSESSIREFSEWVSLY